MELKEIAPGHFTSAQLEPRDMKELARRGIRSVINNRPDHESWGQPTNAELETHARAAGLAWRFAPIRTREPDAAELAAFQKALDELEGPVVAFCRTGTRSSIGLAALGTTSRG